MALTGDGGGGSGLPYQTNDGYGQVNPAWLQGVIDQNAQAIRAADSGRIDLRPLLVVGGILVILQFVKR